MSQALLHLKEVFGKHCSGVVSAGPRNSMYHIASQICRNYILHNNSDFVFGWGTGRKILLQVKVTETSSG